MRYYNKCENAFVKTVLISLLSYNDFKIKVLP